MMFQALIEGYVRSKSYTKFSSNEYIEPNSLTHVVYYFLQGDLPELPSQVLTTYQMFNVANSHPPKEFSGMKQIIIFITFELIKFSEHTTLVVPKSV